MLLNLTIKGWLILALRYTNSSVAWHEDIKTERNSAQANNLVKVQAGYGEQAHRIALCLSLFHYPCASSPDQLRQEEPHGYWGHLSLLFAGLTKAAHVFPGCRVTCFSPPSEHTHICRARVPGNLTPWGRDCENAHYYTDSFQVRTVMSKREQCARFRMRNKERTWKTGWNCFNATFFLVCFGVEMLTWHTTLTHNTTASVWERLESDDLVLPRWRSLTKSKIEQNLTEFAVLCSVRVNDGMWNAHAS